MAIWVLAVAAIIGSVSFNARVSALLGSGGAKATRFVGLTIYPLYLIHQQVGFEIICLLKRRAGFSTSVFFTGSLMILLSYLIVRLLKKPLQKAFKAALGVSPKQSTSRSVAWSTMGTQLAPSRAAEQA